MHRSLPEWTDNKDFSEWLTVEVGSVEECQRWLEECGKTLQRANNGSNEYLEAQDVQRELEQRQKELEQIEKTKLLLSMRT